jgi:hypothetical protein
MRTSKTNPEILCIVVPCYSAQEVIEETASRLLAELNQMDAKGLIAKVSFVFVADEGSSHRIFEKIVAISSKHAEIRFIKLS